MFWGIDKESDGVFVDGSCPVEFFDVDVNGYLDFDMEAMTIEEERAQHDNIVIPVPKASTGRM